MSDWSPKEKKKSMQIHTHAYARTWTLMRVPEYACVHIRITSRPGAPSVFVCACAQVGACGKNSCKTTSFPGPSPDRWRLPPFFFSPCILLNVSLPCLSLVSPFCLKYQRRRRHVNILIISKGTKADGWRLKRQARPEVARFPRPAERAFLARLG